jgi:tRNA nucleotidyltransferase/poly(A) polymerase
VNALYFDLDELKIMDPLGCGLKDIKERNIEACSPESLKTDPLRMFRAIRFASKLNFKISNSIQNDIKNVDEMLPLFDQKVSRRRIGTELDKMLSDRRGGIRAIELMTDLGVIDNYVTQLCNPSSSKQNVPDICFIKDTFTQNAHTLAKLLESSIGESDDKDIFKKMYYLCIFKVFENEPDVLSQALSEMQIPKNTKQFVIENLKKYPAIARNEAQDNVHKNEFLVTLAAVEKYLDNSLTVIDKKSVDAYQA